MRNILLIISAALCLAACQEMELSPAAHRESGELHACMEAIGATKTSMDQNNNILWSADDQIIAFMKTSLGIRYQIKEQYVGSSSGGFSKVPGQNNSDDLEAGQEIDHNVVVYPYSDQVWCMKNDNAIPAESYKVGIDLPEVQTYTEDSFGNGAFPMIAISSDNQLAFKNICGGVKLLFKGNDKIKSIKFEGIENEPVSGQAYVVGYADGSAPAISMGAAAYSNVTLDCGDGVQLSPDSPVTFIIAVPPTEFKCGMRITVTDTDGLCRTLTNTSANTIKRSSLLTFPVITYTQDGIFEFAEDASDTYEVSAKGGTIEIPVVTNHDFEVISSSDWVKLADTKALRNESIKLIVDECAGQKRSATINIVDASSKENLASVLINQKGGVEFNEKHCIYYKENKTGGWDGDDYRLYKSYISCNAGGTKVEMKFKIQSAGSYYLASGSNTMKDCDKFKTNESNLYLYDDINEDECQTYSWNWSEIGVSQTDLITLTFSGKDETITVNGKVLKCPGMKSMYWNYLFSAYARERDEGEWKSYYGVPDGSSLYYVKMYDSKGKMTYEGFAAKAVNPETSKKEYCWYSRKNDTETFQFANDAKNKGGYGGNF